MFRPGAHLDENPRHARVGAQDKVIGGHRNGQQIGAHKIHGVIEIEDASSPGVLALMLPQEASALDAWPTSAGAVPFFLEGREFGD